MRENYLVEHTVGSVIRATFEIYFRHFGTLCLMSILPVFPFTVIQQEAQRSGNTLFFILSILLVFIVSGYAYAATTVAVSDVCVGNAPSFTRSYSKMLSKSVLLLLVTNILGILAVAVGLVLLVIPGLVLSFWLMLSPPIVVLEGRSGIAALKRSKQLGDGSHWRNVGLILLLTVVSAVVGAVFGVLLGVVLFVTGLDIENWIVRALMSMLNALFIPMTFILMVLIYYDRRVCKEGYDAKALAEDLAR